MTARTLTGNTSSRPRHAFAAVLVLASVVALALGAGRAPVTMADGDAATVGEGGPVDPSYPDAASSEAAIATESPIPTGPVETTPETEEPAGDAASEGPGVGDPSPPTEAPVAEPDPTATPPQTVVPSATADASIDPPGDALRAAAESTAIEIGVCEPAVGSDAVIGHGGTGTYRCDALITVVQVPAAFTEMVLDWGVVAEVTPGWLVELRALGDTGSGTRESWTPGAAPGLAVVEHLGPVDDVDGNPDDGVFSYEVQFEIRLTAPGCGGPISPDVTVTPSVLPTIDGTAGWRRSGELYRQVRPSLAVNAPVLALSRTATGDLEDAIDPLRFSHASQTLSAGTLSLTVTSGFCGGWAVSISATDFRSEAGGAAFGAGNLLMEATGAGSGVPQPTAMMTLSNAEQAIVAAVNQPLPAGSYTYAFNLTLTIPGGTPPGTYTATLTVTSTAAP